MKWIIFFWLFFVIDRSIKVRLVDLGFYFSNQKMIFGLIKVNKMLIFSLLVIIAFYFLKRKSWSLFLIFVGGVCNLADRLIYGFVVDYIDIFLPVFNLADIYIASGLIIFFKEDILKWSQR